eukprot:scaffold75719_cov71-Phaeocystis_antarctica.AAC.3
MKAPPRLHEEDCAPGLPPRHRTCIQRPPLLPCPFTQRESQTEYCRSSLLGFEAPGTAPGSSRETSEVQSGGRPTIGIPWVAALSMRPLSVYTP